MKLSRFVLAMGCWILSALTTSAISDTGSVTPQPVPRNGPCPSYYSQNGGYCVPMNEMAPFVIRRVGSCPAFYSQSNQYCVAGRGAKYVIIKEGDGCPPGWTGMGDYCQMLK